jgi:sulfur carrier protein
MKQHEITVNGEARSVPEGSTLADLVAALGQAPQALATAVNGEFVARDARGGVQLRAGDAVFTFQPITGG